MERGDLFRSCCDALDRLIDGMGAETCPEMSEEQTALAIVHAARRDHPYTEAFWQKYRRPDGEFFGSRSEHYHKERPDYRYATGDLHYSDVQGGEATMRRARRVVRHKARPRRASRRKSSTQKTSLLSFFIKLLG